MDLSAHIGRSGVCLITMCESSKKVGDAVVRVNDRVAAGFESSNCSSKQRGKLTSFTVRQPASWSAP